MRTLRRDPLLAAAWLAAAMLIALAFAGCADPIAAARNSVATASTVQKDMLAAFVAFDKEHQAAIVAGSTSKTEGQAALAAYRAQREKAVTGFHALWLSTVATETATNLAEAGLKNKSDLLGMITALLQTVADLRQAVEMLGVKLPGGI